MSTITVKISLEKAKKTNKTNVVMEWIKVSERLPELGERVLVCEKDFGVQVGHLDIKVKWQFSYSSFPSVIKITHWMPLPNPPKE